MTTNPNDPAFPVTIVYSDPKHKGKAPDQFPGLTKREHFAALAPPVPDWFRVDYPMKYQEVFHAPFPHGGCSHQSRSGHCDKCKEWDEKQEDHSKNGRAEKEHVEMLRFIKWRTFYADALISALSTPQ